MPLISAGAYTELYGSMTCAPQQGPSRERIWTGRQSTGQRLSDERSVIYSISHSYQRRAGQSVNHLMAGRARPSSVVQNLGKCSNETARAPEQEEMKREIIRVEPLSTY